MSQPPIRAVIAPVTPLQQNCTIVWCARTMKAAVIDPGGEVQRLMGGLQQHGLTLGSPMATSTTPAPPPS